MAHGEGHWVAGTMPVQLRAAGVAVIWVNDTAEWCASWVVTAGVHG